MKTFFRLSIVLTLAFFAGISSGKADIALEGFFGDQHVANGRYFRDPRPDGSTEYKAFRSDETFNAQLIRYNLATGRWELLFTRRSDGVLQLGGFSNITSSVNVFASGWRTAPGSGPVSVTWPLKLYTPIEQYTSCNNCVWSNPITWRSGIVPRAYDNVVIDGNIMLDIPAKCHSLHIAAGTSASPVNTLVGHTPESRLKLYGSLSVWLMMDITELEFAGNSTQTVEMASYAVMMASRIIINTTKEILLGSNFRFTRVGEPRCVTEFRKGKVHLGDYNLRCQDIEGADENKFIVTNGTGMLELLYRTAGSPMLHRFPVGPSPDRYTPMLVMFATINREYSNMRAKASYQPELFQPGEHINILYTVDHGTTLPPSGTPLSWVYQVQWDAADATPGFNPAHPVKAQKWNGSSWVSAAGGGTVTGPGPYKYLFTTRSTGLTRFGISTEMKRIGTRINAEEAEMIEPEKEVNFGTFPNPATSAGFNVNVANASTAKLQLQNLAGIAIPFTSQQHADNSLAIQPKQNLTSGIYLLQVRENDKTRVHKVLVK